MIEISYKIYTYGKHSYYYLTLNGRQFGPVMFTLQEVNEQLKIFEKKDSPAPKNLPLNKWQFYKCRYSIQFVPTYFKSDDYFEITWLYWIISHTRNYNG